jgi:hypothetical protein
MDCLHPGPQVPVEDCQPQAIQKEHQIAADPSHLEPVSQIRARCQKPHFEEVAASCLEVRCQILSKKVYPIREIPLLRRLHLAGVPSQRHRLQTAPCRAALFSSAYHPHDQCPRVQIGSVSPDQRSLVPSPQKRSA